MSKITADQLRLIDEVQLRYIDALDRKDMQGWLNTFDAEASYIVRTDEGEQAGWPMALILDDCHGRIEDRVKFVDKVWAGTFQDYQTRHMVQRLECTGGADGLFDVRSNFIIAFTRSDTGKSDVFVTGVYHDKVKLNGDTASFRNKRVVLDAPLLPHYLVYPF